MDNNEERKPLLISNGMHYGARFNQNDQTPTSSPGRKVIYCVHGKPSTGCCKVLEGEVIDIDNSNVSIGSNARENPDATNEINKHCHISQSKEIDKNARKKLIIASILCVIFMLLEVTGGYISGSLAIATDAAHLLTDFASFMISLFSIWMATRPATKNMPFGWYRAEVIGALTSVLLIWVVTGVLVYLAIQRVIEENFNIDALVMLITSAVGVGVNLIMGLTLHHHGHSHTMDNKKHSDRHDENINVRAAFIHVVGDFLQSFGVFLAALVIYFKPEYRLIDPICTFIFSVIVLITTFNIIKDTLQVLMEGIPKGIDFNDVMKIFLEVEGVKRVHNLRFWALSLDKLALSAHLVIVPETNPQLILMNATRNIHEKYNVFEMTLQIEEFQEIMEDCYQCKNPV